jgi:hypothetical protein
MNSGLVQSEKLQWAHLFLTFDLTVFASTAAPDVTNGPASHIIAKTADMSIVWSKAVNFAMKGWTNNFAKDK